MKEVTDVIDRDVSHAAKEGNYICSVTLTVKELEKKRDDAREAKTDLDRKLAEAEDKLRKMLIEQGLCEEAGIDQLQEVLRQL